MLLTHDRTSNIIAVTCYQHNARLSNAIRGRWVNVYKKSNVRPRAMSARTKRAPSKACTQHAETQSKAYITPRDLVRWSKASIQHAGMDEATRVVHPMPIGDLFEHDSDDAVSGVVIILRQVKQCLASLPIHWWVKLVHELPPNRDIGLEGCPRWQHSLTFDLVALLGLLICLGSGWPCRRHGTLSLGRLRRWHNNRTLSANRRRWWWHCHWGDVDIDM